MTRWPCILPFALIACADGGEEISTDFQSAEYLGVETRLLDDDLVQFRVQLASETGASDVTDYAECAAAGYTLVRGYGFARHVRTQVQQAGIVWTADSVYTISPGLPDGIKTLDAEVVAANCRERGIPMV